MPWEVNSTWLSLVDRTRSNMRESASSGEPVPWLSLVDRTRSNMRESASSGEPVPSGEPTSSEELASSREPVPSGEPASSREPVQSRESVSSIWALKERDISAIAYSKSLLVEGDTLVVISYPNDQELYNPAGFKLSSKNHRVHSEKILATGSGVFQKLLSDRAQQRALKRAGYNSSNPLPTGIKYVLDLTPPDEGDDAVELISNLSCSHGIRRWAKIGTSFGVDKKLVTGRDEFVRPRHYPIEEHNLSLSPNEDGSVNEDEILEYCPVRHRAGIERLLRLIEGRDPRLDSAPKILTLAVLGKYFDCTRVVAGFIESWFMTEPNNKFIEVLPEEAFQIGLYLNSRIIVEPAFAVLVSEGAFLTAARMKPEFTPFTNNTTQFGRPKGDINEDELNRIEAASNDFQSRINGVANKLVEPSMTWLQELPEFCKLIFFKEKTFPNSQSRWAVENIVTLLGHYVRGRILAVDTAPIQNSHNVRANNNRRFEHYLEPYDGNFEYLYDTMSSNERYLTWFYWDIVGDMQWHIGSGSNMTLQPQPNSLAPPLWSGIAPSKGVVKVNMAELSNAQEQVNDTMLSEMKEGNYYRGHIPQKCYTAYNATSPAKETNLHPFWDLDVETDGHRGPLLQNFTIHETALGTDKATQIDINGVNPQAASEPFAPMQIDSESSTPTHKPPQKIFVPNEIYTANYSNLPFFSLRAFLAEVQSHLSSICRSMREDRYFGPHSFVDTLVCMSSEELKYLPLWAGGNEDGTGGVFEKPIPPAEYGAAPNGPGPAYHTGVSVFSQTSSIVDIGEDDDQMTEVGTVNTSIAVENGFSSHVDRRVVMSDFGSIASYVHVPEHEGKGKGKEVEHYDDHDYKSEDTGKGEFHDVEEEDEEDFMMVSGDEDEFSDPI